MTMYLPNPDLLPTGYEPAEFIDTHRAGEPGDRRPAYTELRAAPVVHLDRQARLDITHRAEEYISRLVEINNGDREDVRTVIHDLHYQVNVIDHDGNPHVAVRPVGNPSQHPEPSREESP
jgi:hypothetical protein